MKIDHPQIEMNDSVIPVPAPIVVKPKAKRGRKPKPRPGGYKITIGGPTTVYFD